MSFQSLMNSTMTVSRSTRTPDGLGGFTTAMNDIYTDAPCRIQPLGGAEQTIYDKQGVPSTHKLFCETGYSFIEDDTITVNSEEYDIVLVRNIDLMDHHLEVNLRRVKPNI